MRAWLNISAYFRKKTSSFDEKSLFNRISILLDSELIASDTVRQLNSSAENKL
jgi:hypothetical protein